MYSMALHRALNNAMSGKAEQRGKDIIKKDLVPFLRSYT